MPEIASHPVPHVGVPFEPVGGRVKIREALAVRSTCAYSMSAEPRFFKGRIDNGAGP